MISPNAFRPRDSSRPSQLCGVRANRFSLFAQVPSTRGTREPRRWRSPPHRAAHGTHARAGHRGDATRGLRARRHRRAEGIEGHEVAHRRDRHLDERDRIPGDAKTHDTHHVGRRRRPVGSVDGRRRRRRATNELSPGVRPRLVRGRQRDVLAVQLQPARGGTGGSDLPHHQAHVPGPRVRGGIGQHVRA